jgi:hypothetical protein
MQWKWQRKFRAAPACCKSSNLLLKNSSFYTFSPHRGTNKEKQRPL